MRREKPGGKREKRGAAAPGEGAQRQAREPAKADKAVRGTPTFSDQMRVAKAKGDPLLDQIVGKGQDKPRAPR